jgi:two-component system nitrogen regulation sensor histidine kinase NtrY
MSFRTKIILATTFTLVVTVWAVAWVASAAITRSFEERDGRRTTALVEQVHREFTRRGEEISQRVANIADSQALQHIAASVGEPNGDTAQYVEDAAGIARDHALDFLEIVAPDGSIVSSAQWSARYGYKELWLTATADWKPETAFLKKEELKDGTTALGLEAVRTVPTPAGPLYVVGGQRLDTQASLDSMPLGEGMELCIERDNEIVGGCRRDRAAALNNLAQDAARRNGKVSRLIANDRSFTAIPLPGRDNALLAVLLIGNSRADLLSLKSFIRGTSLVAGGGGILLGIVLCWWAASRVTRPLKSLTGSVRQVAAGDWDVRAPVRSRDEVGQLAKDFNTMTHQLVEQKQRIIQTERVAAWRELARRLAHELKNPLFPLQITIENLQRVRERSPEQFEDVFRESTTTLLSELDNLKTIIGRFSEFSKMPAPRLETVDVNEVARDVVRLFAAQFVTPEKPPIAARLDLADHLPKVDADPEQLRRALRNLVLNAMDAMPNGGDLTIRTRSVNGHVAIEVADSGEGLTKEECERLFTPYYTTKRHGTGLGLAIVQSVVADHGGSIAVDSEPGKGASFRIELAAKEPGVGGRSNGESHTARR